MIYKDQSAHNLRLSLFQDNENLPSIFDILKEGKVSNDKVEVSAGIIGGSHFIKITNTKNGEVFYEVFACDDLKGQDGLIVTYQPHQASYEGFNTQQDSYKYSFQPYLYDFGDVDGFGKCFDKESLLNSHCEFSKDSCIELYFDFPSADGSSDSMSFTSVFVLLEDDDVKMRTLHHYPNENSVVVTLSVFTVV